MTTGVDIVTSALLKARVTGVGNPPDAEQTTRAFSLLNDMLALWSSQRWLTYHLLGFRHRLYRRAVLYDRARRRYRRHCAAGPDRKRLYPHLGEGRPCRSTIR
jgi:hypothetical protein